MSSSLGVRIEGKRYVVKTTPMMKLEAVLEDALKQAQKQWTTSDCAMTFNKKKLDLGDPVRFCNVPTGDRRARHLQHTQ